MDTRMENNRFNYTGECKVCRQWFDWLAAYIVPEGAKEWIGCGINRHDICRSCVKKWEEKASE